MARLESKKALIADDDPIYRETGAESLREGGFEVVAVEDGASAVRALDSAAFSIAMIDLSMPDVCGLDVIRAQRRGGPNMLTPSIVITGHEDAASVREAFDAGATSYLTKPLNWVLFLPHIEFVLRTARLERELREAMEATEFLGDLKTKLMSGLAHEFQEPIKTMFGFTELMRREVYGPVGGAEYRGFVSDMSRALSQLNAALLKLLDSGRGLKEHLSLREESLEVHGLISDAIASQADHCASRGILIDAQVNLARDIGVYGDRALIGQMLRTLVEGAVRNAPRGSKVRFEVGQDPAGAISFVTADGGEAFGHDLLSEINSEAAVSIPQITPKYTRDLGLRVSKILVEAHQGEITVEADRERGNRCRIRFPRGRVRKSSPPSADMMAARFATALSDSTADVFARPQRRPVPGQKIG